MKILFSSRSWLIPVVRDITCYLNKQEVTRTVTVFHNKFDPRRVSKYGQCYYLNDFWDEGRTAFSVEELIRLSEGLHDWNLNQIIRSDRFLRNMPMKQVIEYISYYFYAWQRIIESEKPDIVIDEPVNGIWNFALFQVAKRTGIEYFGYAPSKVKDKYYFTSDLSSRFTHFEYNLSKIMAQTEPTGFRQLAEEFISDFHEKRSQPYYMNDHKKVFGIYQLLLPKHTIRSLVRILFNRKSTEGDVTVESLKEDIVGRFKKIARVNAMKVFPVFDRPVHDCRYALFPLHFQPEVSTDFWSPYYSNQIDVIKAIARSLPFGMYLYVKEHSNFLGTKSLAFYKELKKIHNVKLVGPFESIHDLIRNSEIVCVITSTTGLEALFYKKPVIVIGDVFYDNGPNCFKVNSLKELPKIIARVLDSRYIDKQEYYLRFIAALINSGYETVYYKADHSETEITSLVDGIFKEFTFRKEKMRV